MVPNLPQWGINPVPTKHRILRGLDYFILWSSLGVGLLVFSAGSFLSETPFYHALLAIIIGSIAGSVLLSMAGKIGSDHAVPSLIGIRPAFGLYGSYLAAVLNIIQLIGWTTFEILILSKAAEQLTNMHVTFVWNIIFGVIITLLGIFGPLFLVKQWLSKFAIWIVYASSAIILVTLLFQNLPNVMSGEGKDMSFFVALDIVIAMPISWMPLVSDYNRFAKTSKGAFIGTLIGFSITNIIFYVGGLLFGVGDISSIIISIQAILSGFILLVMIVDEIDNAFADIYSAAISSQSIFHNLNQRHLIIGFSIVSTILAIFVSIEGYEQFLFLIGALFIPLFGVLLTDYFVIKRGKYQNDMMYGNKIIKIGYPAIIAWVIGAVLYYLLSQLSPIYLAQLPTIGSTIPSLIISSLLYLLITKLNLKFKVAKTAI
ncbi:MAG: cytosine permease [Nitrososphaeraceae archaeon]|nr:cytosine permease [Nitrososphaeraceae archaeon]MDW0143784.1 cytosine permease [Nitrososphaeraceae archaeon]MDW0145564.1 cytosine permease [Nitrososphaeraceae archaeon]MDW0151985.1 cytosine permease [Nitrososphaeraceae archaeon]MDW0166094.1 cytosine permease [Nitrososphaeraceae archaeon]